jgi:predicted PurR-regulated permease PerM
MPEIILPGASEPPRGTFRNYPLAVVAFTLFALLIVWAAGKIVAPYITPILIAAIIVTFTFPLYRKLRTRMKGRGGLAAVVMLIGVTVVIAIPAFILTLMLVQQATHLIELIQRTDFQAVFSSIQLNERLGWVRRYVPAFNPGAISFDQVIVRIVQQIPAFVAAYGTKVLGGFAGVLIGFAMTLLASYFFYTEGERLVAEVKSLSPLPDEYDEEIFRKFRGVVDATFRGQVLTALAQGLVTGIGLAIAGVPAPILWGAVAALFSLIPMVGAATVWVPGSIYLFILASMDRAPLWQGIFLVAWGIGVVSLVDNLIRPWAMKSGTNMNAIVLFFSIIGGLAAFGFTGLILGPLVFALLVTVVQMYREVVPKQRGQSVGDEVTSG